MSQTKVRCTYCGAKNTDTAVDRCRICGGILPGGELRRKQLATGGDTFKTLVEGEVESWNDYEANGGESARKSRRPDALPPVIARTAVPGQDSTTSMPVIPTAPVVEDRVATEPADQDSAELDQEQSSRWRLFRR